MTRCNKKNKFNNSPRRVILDTRKIFNNPTCRIIIPAVVLLGLAASLAGSSTHATSVDFNINVHEVPVLEITLGSSDYTVSPNPSTITMDVVPNIDGSSIFRTSDLAVTVATSNPSGYYLSMGTSSTSLVSGSNSIPSLGTGTFVCTVSTAASCNFTNNTWGYRLSTDTANTYKAIPTIANIANYNSTTNGITTNLTFGTRISSSLPSGLYSTTINFVATANPIITFDGAMMNAGKTKVSNYYAMQDMSGSICSSVTEAVTGTLIDTRDNKTYAVAKINGNCWMTQNLRTTGTVTAAKSNFSGNDFNICAIDLASSGNHDNTTQSGCHDSSTATYGVWYNYYAVTAGTISGISNSTDASSDICPSGWKLPTHSEQSSIVNYATIYNATAGGMLFWQGGSIMDAGRGRYWSQTAYSSSNRHSLYWDSDTAALCSTQSDCSSIDDPNDNRINGLFARCIAKTQ